MKQLNIQSKLFIVFGVITLAGVLAIGVNIFNVTRMEAGNSELLRWSQRSEDAYAALDLLQGIELAETDYILRGDPAALDRHAELSGRLDLYIRKTLLEAETPQEKEALSALDRAKHDYEPIFEPTVAAADANDEAALNSLGEASGQSFESMYAQIQDINDTTDAILEETDATASFFELMALLASLLALGLFFALTVVAAIIVANQVYRPVLLMADSAADIQAHRFTPETLARLSTRTDEIGRLGRAFVRMAAALHSREDRLRQQVEEMRARVEQAK